METTSKSTGKKIKELRIRGGLSLQKLGDKAAVSKTHIYELEHDKVKNPSLTVIQRIADAFNVSPFYFLENNNDTEFQVIFRDLQSNFLRMDAKSREIFMDIGNVLIAKMEKAKDV